MKREALEELKANLTILYGKYYTESTNKWIMDICGDDAFVEYKEVTEFKLADLNSDLTPGEIDFYNCKILYEKLQFLSESQASDERLWAGLTHTTFYDYMRRRWGYGYGKKPKSAEKEVGEILTRFFYKSSRRGGFYRNTLAKCWWVGHNTYNPNNLGNHFENLDVIGSNDLSSKITELFYNFTFSSNPVIMSAIIEALRKFRDEGKTLSVRNHIRPAMSYLNAVGGSIVIDCLEKEEIMEIFSNAIEAIIQGDIPSLNFDRDMDEEIDDTDALDNENSDDVDNTEVMLGCKVVIGNTEKETKTYKYDFINGVLPQTLEVFTGHKIGDVVELMGKEWKIQDIVL
jgi:hypothetical protein